MPVKIKGKTHYRTSEAARIAGISRSTLLRWLHDSVVEDSCPRDRRGWRLFSEDDISRIADEANKSR